MREEKLLDLNGLEHYHSKVKELQSAKGFSIPKRPTKEIWKRLHLVDGYLSTSPDYNDIWFNNEQNNKTYRISLASTVNNDGEIQIYIRKRTGNEVTLINEFLPANTNPNALPATFNAIRIAWQGSYLDLSGVKITGIEYLVNDVDFRVPFASGGFSPGSYRSYRFYVASNLYTKCYEKLVSGFSVLWGLAPNMPKNSGIQTTAGSYNIFPTGEVYYIEGSGK